MNELLNCKGQSTVNKKFLQKPKPDRPRSMYIQ